RWSLPPAFYSSGAGHNQVSPVLTSWPKHRPSVVLLVALVIVAVRMAVGVRPLAVGPRVWSPIRTVMTHVEAAAESAAKAAPGKLATTKVATTKVAATATTVAATTVAATAASARECGG